MVPPLTVSRPAAAAACGAGVSIRDNEAVMRRWRIALILAACFLFRLFFGLSREFFFEDQTQIFLLGFRYYATDAWPFFGPDVVWTRSEIPGALQALLVGVPLTSAVTKATWKTSGSSAA